MTEHLESALPSPLEPAGRTIGAEERAAVLEVLDSAVLNASCDDRWIRDLETQFEQLHDIGNAVACSSGTAALHLALSTVVLEPGDEVITTPFTDFGTIIPILAQNAVPVFADVDPVTGNLAVSRVLELISDRTRAIIVVHLFGAAADIGPLRAEADRRGITIIEDCAQAYLARSADDAVVGTLGHVGCFSLQQYKHITCGDGGVAITADPVRAEQMRLFADKGWPRSGRTRTHVSFGMNYRMTNLQAAVAGAQARKLPDIVGQRRSAASRLFASLDELPGLALPSSPERHSFWVMPLVLTHARPGANHEWAARMTAAGIPTSAGWLERPAYDYPVLADRRIYGTSGFPFTAPPARNEWHFGPGLCPEAERLIGSTLVMLPWNENYTHSQVDRIAAAIMDTHAHLG